MSLATIFLIVALILFILASVPTSSRISLGWLGLAFVTAAELLGHGIIHA